MTDPIFVVGPPRSGMSVVAALLHRAAGAPVAEVRPSDADNPIGYFEPQGLVDADRQILAQLDCDETCPPTWFRPEWLDLGALADQWTTHVVLASGWMVKDPSAMFLLPAWRAVGLDRVRLVGVVRAPGDNARSLAKDAGLRADRAEAIVDVYLRRLAELSDRADVAIVRFSADGADVVDQVRRLASALGLSWDETRSAGLFEPELVHHDAPLRETSPAYDLAVARAFDLDGRPLPATALGTLELRSAPQWPLETQLGPRYHARREELWRIARFPTADTPVVVEIVLEGARKGRARRPGVADLRRLQVSSLDAIGAALVAEEVRPHGVVVHGALADARPEDAGRFFASVHPLTYPFATLVVDVPAPEAELLADVLPPPSTTPTPEDVVRLAEPAGWEHLDTVRVSPGSVGMTFRRRPTIDDSPVNLEADLVAALGRADSLDADLADTRAQLADTRAQLADTRAQLADTRSQLAAMTQRHDEVARDARGRAARLAEMEARVAIARRRAEAAERDLERLRARRSVRAALALSRPSAVVFRMVRAWKKR